MGSGLGYDDGYLELNKLLDERDRRERSSDDFVSDCKDVHGFHHRTETVDFVWLDESLFEQYRIERALATQLRNDLDNLHQRPSLLADMTMPNIESLPDEHRQWY